MGLAFTRASGWTPNTQLECCGWGYAKGRVGLRFVVVELSRLCTFEILSDLIGIGGTVQLATAAVRCTLRNV